MFQEHGYYKEYWVEGKFIGIISGVDKDREVLGFYGAITETLTNNINLTNGRVIKKGTQIKTQLHYLNGKKCK